MLMCCCYVLLLLLRMPSLMMFLLMFDGYVAVGITGVVVVGVGVCDHRSCWRVWC